MKRTVLFNPLMLQSVKVKEKEYALYDAACENLALRVQPTGAISWVTWRRSSGKTRRVTLGRFDKLSLEDARQRARTYSNPLSVETAAPPAPCPDFKTLAQMFISEKSGVYSEGGLASFKTYLRNELLPAFGSQALNRITPAEVAQWFHRFSQKSPGGANQALGHFTTLVNWGIAKGHLPDDFRNPARPIRRNRRAARGRMLNAEQLRSLARTLRMASPRHRHAADAILIILLTGCRSGEILRLRWSEVGETHLSLSRTKTGPRAVILTAPVKTRVEARREVATSEYVFPSSHNPDKAITSIDGAWKTLKRMAGLPDDIRLHDLRHTYASHAIMSGESLAITGKLLGHKNPRSTEVYAHLDPSHLGKMADKAAKLVEDAMAE